LGEGTNASPINMRGIRITTKVVAFLVFGGWFDRLTIKRVMNGFILNGFTVKGANGLGGYAGRKFGRYNSKICLPNNYFNPLFPPYQGDLKTFPCSPPCQGDIKTAPLLREVRIVSGARGY
jgi:hypothetical protein